MTLFVFPKMRIRALKTSKTLSASFREMRMPMWWTSKVNDRISLQYVYNAEEDDISFLLVCAEGFDCDRYQNGRRQKIYKRQKGIILMRQVKAIPITHENFAPFGQFYTMADPKGYALCGEIHKFFPRQIDGFGKSQCRIFSDTRQKA